SQAESLEQRTLLTAELFLQGSSFVDANGNNEFDGGDVPKVGATIELYNSDGTSLLATTTTDANGGYVFDQTNFPGLVPGTYQITEIPTAGFVNSGVEILSDLNPATGLSSDTVQVTLVDPTDLQVTVDSNDFFGLNRFEVTSTTFFAVTSVNSIGQFPASIDGAGLTSPIDFYTYCVDLYNQFGNGSQTYDVETNPTTTGPNSTPNTGRISYLYNHYGRSLVSGSFTGNTPSVEAAGLQMAIYELIYDPGSPDLTSGNYSAAYDPAYASFTSAAEFAAAVSAAEDFLADSAGKSEKAIFLNTTTFPATPGRTYSQSIIISGSYNFANIPAAALGDFVWEDTNANGIQDPGEPGIEGVTVNLLDENMVPIPGATTTTDSSGAYSFTDLVPGNYIVQFVTPGGYVQTFQDVNNDGTNQDPNVDSDAGVDGKTAVITLSSGETDNTIDAGYYELAALGDFVWEDTNANGIQDPGEPGIEGVTVNLLDENMVPIPGATTTTDSNGAYSFTDLVPGNYIVQFVTPAGLVQTAQDVNNDGTNQDPNVDSDAGVDGKTAIITLSSGETDNTIDSGYYELAALGDFVWEDTNANGIQDPGEPGIEGVTVNLLDENMVPIPGATTTTDSSGAYSFTDLVPGNYIVQFVTPAGLVQTAQDVNNDGTNQDPNVDSDAGVDGKTAVITLSSGETDNTIDAGYYNAADIDIEKLVRIESTPAPTGGDVCGDYGKPEELTFRYVAGAAASSYQPDGKYSVTGVAPASEVHVVASKESDFSKVNSTNSFFDSRNGSPIDLGDSFVVDVDNASGVSSFGSSTYIFVLNSTTGNVVQTVGYHTSCSAPIVLGDIIGGVQLIGFLGEGATDPVVLPDPNFSPGLNDADADTPSGPVGLVGDTAVFTFVVTNPGTVPLNNVVVSDPDFVVTYVSGDDGDDGVLEHGEQWVYTASAIVESGSHVNLATVTGTPVGTSGVTVSDEDPAHWLGVTAFMPDIDIDKTTNGQDGALVEVGDSATFTYTVTNTGNVPLNNVIVTDDNGTPSGPVTFTGITGDDLCGDFDKPHQLTFFYTGGNADATNTQQDPGKYEVIDANGGPNAIGTVTIVATGESDFNSVSLSDPDNYFSGTVSLNTSFVVDSGSGDFGSHTYIYIMDQNGTLLQTVDYHTSCSTPIVLGDVLGGVTLTGYVDQTGAGPTSLQAVSDTNSGDDFNPVLVSGDTDLDGVLDLNETWIFEASRTVTAGWYTNLGSVSADDDQGTTVTDQDGSSHFGFNPAPTIDVEKFTLGLTADATQSVDLCDELGKPHQLSFVYTGGGEDATSTAQPADKFEVTGDPNDAATVRIVSSKESDPTKVGPDNTFFDGEVNLNEAFTVDVANAGLSSFGSHTYVYILSAGGSLLDSADILQTVDYHTSCSAPIVLGDVLGGITLIGYVDEFGESAALPDPGVGELGEDADDPDANVNPIPVIAMGEEVQWTYTVTNTGNQPFAANDIVITDDGGTPFDMSDDLSTLDATIAALASGDGFNPGDANTNDVLDTGETWYYRAVDTVMEEGLYGNLATASISSFPAATDSDPSHYEGVLPAIDFCSLNDHGDVSELTFRFTASDLVATTQDKFEIESAGTVAGLTSVRIVVSSDPDGGGDVYFDDTVNAGDSFTAFSLSAGESKFGSKVFVRFLAPDGSELKELNIHTSCSSPLVLGDQFGGVQLRGIASDNGTQIGVDSQPLQTANASDISLDEFRFDKNKVKFELTNTGSLPAILDSIRISFPGEFGKLKKIKANGDEIYNLATSASSFTISDFNRSILDRTLLPGQTIKFELEFENDLSKLSSAVISNFSLDFDFDIDDDEEDLLSIF
ncbi:MAG: SdrD B-like domain-containing protein, partial [Fuerstiella sp.]